MQNLPPHLQKYIVSQHYEKYTALDHAVWRYILRQLKKYLSLHAHESYLEGLIKTGVDSDKIPHIENISSHLEKFGWRALPVSGFIPPAAFMELQSLSILPIASDMRSINHLLYTPAPDIVHEAAGHAPILVNPEYAIYLKQYAQVAKKALISKEDLDLYKAIRDLSDLKENPSSSPQEIKEAESQLNRVSNSISYVSEATELSRMNWWTAEYGLIGSIKSPKIFGAGLLSSVGESKWCQSSKVKKIPLSLDCVKQTYDITEPQPQLFVARDFKHLSQVLEELSQTMSYKIGGTLALERALKAETINSVEFENKLQISGVLEKYYLTPDSKISYLKFSGPTQICYNFHEISEHNNRYHAKGYGMPIGEISDFQIEQLQIDAPTTLNYKSGVCVTGTLKKILNLDSTAKILSFENATCVYKNEKLFLPEWGTYDIILAHEVKSVFSGAADPIAYGEINDFTVAKIPSPHYSEAELNIFSFYQEIRDVRDSNSAHPDKIKHFFNLFKENASQHWLLFVELYELALHIKTEKTFVYEIEKHLAHLAKAHKEFQSLIHEGLNLAHEKH